jgi:protein tyrosine phosphatase (PTP) superfamily phosphohydrolase (DUF442 family)
MTTQDIYNYHKVSERVITTGQPTEAQLKSAAEEGFAMVVNLATERPDHFTEDEADLVRSLGMAYYPIPVEWNDPRPADFEAFESVLQKLGAAKTLIHCAANFRVTAFYSLYAMKYLGWSEAQADTFRMQVWQGSNFPIWEKFIQDLKDSIRQGNS